MTDPRRQLYLDYVRDQMIRANVIVASIDTRRLIEAAAQMADAVRQCAVSMQRFGEVMKEATHD